MDRDYEREQWLVKSLDDGKYLVTLIASTPTTQPQLVWAYYPYLAQDFTKRDAESVAKTLTNNGISAVAHKE